MTLTPSTIRAAAQDAGNKSMRNAGRKVWNEDDYNTACEVFARLSALVLS
jgi:hypothetical protein